MSGWRPRTALGLLVLVAFGSTLLGGFVYDDRFLIVENEYLRDPAQWSRFFTESSWAGGGGEANNYRPLPLLSFGLNYAVGGLRAFDYHLVNLLVHLGNVLLLLALGRRLGLSPPAAWLAAALFAVHPLQTEPVAEIVGRMDLMAGAGFLAALLCHLEARRVATSKQRWRWAAGAVAFYALALWSKEHVILFPLVALAVDRLVLAQRGMRPWAVHGAYAVVAVLYLGIRFTLFPLVELAPDPQLDMSNPLTLVGQPERFVSALSVTGLYIRHAVAPVGLSPEYCYAQVLPIESVTEPRGLVTLLVTVLLIGGAIVLGRRHRRVAVGLLLAAAAFLPVSNLLFPIGTVMGDRLFYLPVAGLALAVAVLADRLRWRNARIWMLGGTAVLLVLVALSFRQSRFWRSDFTLDQRAVAAAPLCARGHSNLGYDLLELEDIDAAERHFLEAVGIHAQYPQARAGLARVSHRRGDRAGALAEAQAVLAMDRTYVAMMHLAANIHRETGRLDLAEAEWRRILTIEPLDVQAASNLAILQWGRGETDEAVALWEAAVRSPEVPAVVVFNLALAYDQLDRLAEAGEMYRRFLDRAGPSADPQNLRRARQRLEELR